MSCNYNVFGECIKDNKFTPCDKCEKELAEYQKHEIDRLKSILKNGATETEIKEIISCLVEIGIITEDGQLTDNYR